MVRVMRWIGAALVAVALVSTAEAQTSPASGTQAQRASAKQHAKRLDGRDITVNKNANATPSWLTLGNDAPVGAGNNYVTSTFDQPSSVQGTFSGYRGRERVTPQYGVPGAPLFQF